MYKTILWSSVVLLGVTACGQGRSAELAGVWGGDDCSGTFVFQPDGTAEYSLLNLFGASPGTYEVDGDSVVFTGQDGALFPFKKSGRVMKQYAPLSDQVIQVCEKLEELPE